MHHQSLMVGHEIQRMCVKVALHSLHAQHVCCKVSQFPGRESTKQIKKTLTSVIFRNLSAYRQLDISHMLHLHYPGRNFLTNLMFDNFCLKATSDIYSPVWDYTHFKTHFLSQQIMI